MYITNSTFKAPIYNQKLYVQPKFKGGLAHTNIGSCLEGYIGKVTLRKANGVKSELNVFKKIAGHNEENYSIMTDKNEILGEINLTINKFHSWNPYSNPTDPSHVYVNELRNYSNPATPFYRSGLEYHKDIGTRLLQIAQRRSDETFCQGNIKLIAMNESKDWYKRVIGMTEEYPQDFNSGFRFRIHNSNSMILPPHSKEPLSRLQDGL